MTLGLVCRDVTPAVVITEESEKGRRAITQVYMSRPSVDYYHYRVIPLHVLLSSRRCREEQSDYFGGHQPNKVHRDGVWFRDFKY